MYLRSKILVPLDVEFLFQNTGATCNMARPRYPNGTSILEQEFDVKWHQYFGTDCSRMANGVKWHQYVGTKLRGAEIVTTYVSFRVPLVEFSSIFLCSTPRGCSVNLWSYEASFVNSEAQNYRIDVDSSEEFFYVREPFLWEISEHSLWEWHPWVEPMMREQWCIQAKVSSSSPSLIHRKRRW